MKFKKNIIIICFAVTFLAPLITFLSFCILKEEAKKEMQVLILGDNYASENITTLKLTNKQVATISWINETEFNYQENTYDLVKRSNINGLTVFSVLVDKKETKLFKNFYENEKHEEKKDFLPFSKIFDLKFLKTNTQLSIAFFNVIPNLMMHFALIYKNPDLKIQTPPPNTSC